MQGPAAPCIRTGFKNAWLHKKHVHHSQTECLRNGERTAAPRILGGRRRAVRVVQAATRQAEQVHIATGAARQSQEVAAAAVGLQFIQRALALLRYQHSAC